MKKLSEPEKEKNKLNYRERQWEERFIELKEFKKKFGNSDVSLARKNNPYYSLATWCNTQRQEKKFHPFTYPPEKEKKLDEIGFSWGILDKIFEQRLKELSAFKKKYGHCNVSTYGQKHRVLGKWVYVQRGRRNNPDIYYDPYRERRLNEIGFSWNPHDDHFEKRFSELMAFKNKFGHCHVPLKGSDVLNEWVISKSGVRRRPKYNFSILNKWCTRQREFRKTKKLESERINRLNKIEFPWKPIDDSFDKKLAELKKFYILNGHSHVPKSQNPSLTKWCVRMRALRRGKTKYGILSPERIKKLDELKFEWETPEFRKRQEFKEKWHENFTELKNYKRTHRGFDEMKLLKPVLYKWMIRQRKFYENKSKYMTPERIKLLNSIGFKWN